MTLTSDRPETALTGEHVLPGEKHGQILAGLLAFCVTLATALLGLALHHHGVAVLWPAAGAVTGFWLITPRQQRPALIAGVALGLFCGNVLADHTVLVNFVFIVENLFQAWLIGALLERWVGRPMRLETLPQAGCFVAATGIAVTASGLATASVLTLMGFTDYSLPTLWGMVVSSRGIGILTVAPAVIALGTLPRHATEMAWRSRVRTVGLLAWVVFVSYLLVSIGFIESDLLALVTLLIVVFPFALWIAARRAPVWTYVSLLLFTLVVVWKLGSGEGLLHGNVELGQALLLVSSLWALTLAVVMQQQRRSMELAHESEHSMRQALAAGRGFTFAYDPLADHVLRTDPDRILAPFIEESGASFFERVLQDDRPRLQQLIVALTPHRPMYETTYGARRPDGKIVWLQERGVGEFDEHGALVRLHGLTMDITRRREIEDALHEADRKKDRFIATLAHELRNPLAPIRTAAELLGYANANPAQTAWARDVIRRQVSHMASLLDDLLDVARITQGKLELRLEPVDLGSVIETAVEAAQPILDAHRHRLLLRVPEPAPWLRADRVRMAQVLSNLLTNAAKYSDDGGEISLEARVEGNELEISVTDHGIGIEPEALGSVFEMFAQVKGASSRSEGGLGIGLSLVKGIVELHGGKVSAYSEGPGKGSRFVIRMECMPTEAPETSSSPEEIEPATPPGRHILIVDDNRDAADSLSLLLGLDGHDVRVAYAGRQALEVVKGFPLDVAILDLGLPDLSGYDLARLLRQGAQGKTVTLVALTGWGQDEHKQRAKDAGFDHHLTKPVDLDKLAAVIAADGAK